MTGKVHEIKAIASDTVGFIKESFAGAEGCPLQCVKRYSFFGMVSFWWKVFSGKQKIPAMKSLGTKKKQVFGKWLNKLVLQMDKTFVVFQQQ